MTRKECDQFEISDRNRAEEYGEKRAKNHAEKSHEAGAHAF